MSDEDTYKNLTLEKLDDLWKKDANIDENNLIREASKIPMLHNKYYNLYMKEFLRVKKLRSDLKVLVRNKNEWLNGTMAQEDLETLGWKPNPRKIIRQDLDKYIESDKDVIELSLRIDYHEGLAKYLEDIIRQVNNRNFVIKSIIDWARFQSGSM